MKRTTLIIFAIILTISFQNCSSTYRGKTSLVETSKRTAGMPVHNILIIGSGSIPAKAFLVNLSTELRSLFRENKIQSSYTYIRETPGFSPIDSDNSGNDKYDSYLVLNPIGNSVLDLKTSTYTATLESAGGITPRYNVLQQRYKEKFSVELYSIMKGGNIKNWEGILQVDFDFSQKDKYKQMAQSIVDKILRR